MGPVHSTDERVLRGKETFGADDIARSLTRVVFEIIKRNDDTEELIIVGIPMHGVFLAKRLVKRISEAGGLTAEYAIIDPTVFRDDLTDKSLHTPKPTLTPPVEINRRTMILVDDVLYTGRIIKAILDILSDAGRSSRAQFVVLVDRGYRELPIHPNYVGKNLPTSRQETVTILLKEDDGRDDVLLGRES